jgi:Tfp pilus assembly protein PilV
MAEETPTQPPAAPPPLQNVSNAKSDDLLEPGEQVIFEVKRSPMGLVGIYLVALLAVAAFTTLMVILSPGTFKTSSANISGALSLVIVLAAILLVLILFTATHVYRQSRLMVTDRSLVQVMQKTLFNRKVSRLSMSNVEDVNEEQRGLVASLFNYGTLTVQTAGTEDNFIFTMCPNPAQLADKILECRQAYAKSHSES